MRRGHRRSRPSSWLGLGLVLIGILLIVACANIPFAERKKRDDAVSATLHFISTKSPELIVQLLIPALIGCMIHWVALQLYLNST
jgi:drug/metabolite transporter (DMT)-like permease